MYDSKSKISRRIQIFASPVQFISYYYTFPAVFSNPFPEQIGGPEMISLYWFSYKFKTAELINA